MIKIEDIIPGKSYACKFKATNVALDALGRPFPNLSDQPYGKQGEYEGFGVLTKRDTEQKLVELQCQKTKKEFVCTYENIWDIDEVVWTDEDGDNFEITKKG